MSSALIFPFAAVALLAVASCPHPAQAQGAGAAASLPAVTGAPSATAGQCFATAPPATSPPPPAAGPSRGPFASAPVNAAALASQRGGARVANDNQLSGSVAGNQASHLTTGANAISDGAFSGAVGLPTVIQNSGNNVLIQNATIVNVQVK